MLPLAECISSAAVTTVTTPWYRKFKQNRSTRAQPTAPTQHNTTQHNTRPCVRGDTHRAETATVWGPTSVILDFSKRMHAFPKSQSCLRPAHAYATQSGDPHRVVDVAQPAVQSRRRQGAKGAGTPTTQATWPQPTEGVRVDRWVCALGGFRWQIRRWAGTARRPAWRRALGCAGGAPPSRLSALGSPPSFTRME